MSSSRGELFYSLGKGHEDGNQNEAPVTELDSQCALNDIRVTSCRMCSPVAGLVWFRCPVGRNVGRISSDGYRYVFPKDENRRDGGGELLKMRDIYQPSMMFSSLDGCWHR